MTEATRWRVLQIADSAFPTGGFAHSAGLEAAVHFAGAGSPQALDAYVSAHLWSTAHLTMPFAAAAHREPGRVPALDAHLDALLTNHVANRASRTQGRAFIATCADVFDAPALTPLAEAARARRAPGHLAPLFGAALAVVSIDHRDALALYLYLALRGVLSAAVRLGIVGPLEAQRATVRHASTLDQVIDACAGLGPDDAACTAPIADIAGGAHDRLYARLFQS